MLNDYYFEDDKPSGLSIGGKKFQEEATTYLKEQYNYKLEDLQKDLGFTDEDISAFYSDGIHPIDFIEALMEDLSHQHGNYFNIILSGGRNLP